MKYVHVRRVMHGQRAQPLVWRTDRAASRREGMPALPFLGVQVF